MGGGGGGGGGGPAGGRSYRWPAIVSWRPSGVAVDRVRIAVPVRERERERERGSVFFSVPALACRTQLITESQKSARA